MNRIPQASGDMSGWHKLRDFYEIICIALCELPVSRVPSGGYFVSLFFSTTVFRLTSLVDLNYS